MGDNRPVRYEEDGRVIYRASGLALCDKVFVALAMGYQPKAYPAWFQEILDEGSRNEAVIRERYEAETGLQVAHVGKVLEREVINGVWLRGSIDGVVMGGDVSSATSATAPVPVLFEAKKIRDSGWNRYQRVGVEFQANYPMQTGAYMVMLAEALEMDSIDMHFVGGRYVYDEKTDQWSITEIAPHVYIDPPVPWRGIAKRIVGLEKLIAEATVIGDVKCTNKTFPCPMYYLHDEDDDEPPVRPSDDVIAPLLTEWDEIQQRLDAVKADSDRAKAIKASVKEWLRMSGQDSGDVSHVKVGDGEWDLKYLVSSRTAYQVKAGEVTNVTIRQRVKDGKDTGEKAVKKSQARKPRKQPQLDLTQAAGENE